MGYNSFTKNLQIRGNFLLIIDLFFYLLQTLSTICMTPFTRWNSETWMKPGLRLKQHFSIQRGGSSLDHTSKGLMNFAILRDRKIEGGSEKTRWTATRFLVRFIVLQKKPLQIGKCAYKQYNSSAAAKTRLNRRRYQ